jgi:hypothetical protein
LFGDVIDTVEEFYIYHKARFLGNEFVLEELQFLKSEKVQFLPDHIISEVIKIYSSLMAMNEATLKNIEEQYPQVVKDMNYCFCSAELNSLVQETLDKYDRDGRVSKKAIDHIKHHTDI